MKSWNCGTSKQYSPYIRRWCDFSFSRNVNPFNVSINDGAQLLMQYFLRSEYENFIINVALLSTFSYENGLTSDKQPIFQRFLKEMF